MLTDCYNSQQHITKSDNNITHMLLSCKSLKSENLKTTLILMRDNYHDRDVERAPGLLKMYDNAINKLSNY